MKRTFLIAHIWLASLIAHGQTTSADTLRLSLEQCISHAMQHSYSRRQMQLNQATAQEVYRQSKMERLPDLSASVGENLTYSPANATSTYDGSYGLNTSITLYQGGSIGNAIQKSKLAVAQSEERTLQYDNELHIQVLQAFLSALGNEELLKHQQALQQASREQLRQGHDRLRVGDILESDFLLLHAQHATDTNNLAATTIERDISLLALKVLLAIDPAQVLEITHPDTGSIEALGTLPDEATALASALSALPDLRIASYEVEIASLNIKTAKAGYYPTVNLNGSLGSGHQNGFAAYGTQLSDRLTAQAGIAVSIPIFDRSRAKSSVAQSRIALQQAELEQKQAELNLSQTILKEYRSVVSMANSFKTSQIREKAYAASLSAYRAQYAAGAITTVELLQQQTSYTNALNLYIQDKYGFMLRRKMLDVYMGTIKN
jgi:outer membrane protein